MSKKVDSFGGDFIEKGGLVVFWGFFFLGRGGGGKKETELKHFATKWIIQNV